MYTFIRYQLKLFIWIAIEQPKIVKKKWSSYFYFLLAPLHGECALSMSCVTIPMAYRIKKKDVSLRKC